MGGCTDLPELPDGGLVVVIFLGFPRRAAQGIGIIETGVVVSPIAGVFHGSRSRNCGFEARRLSDQPIREGAAIAVAADREVVRIRDSVLHQRVDSLQDIFSRPRY